MLFGKPMVITTIRWGAFIIAGAILICVCTVLFVRLSVMDESYLSVADLKTTKHAAIVFGAGYHRSDDGQTRLYPVTRHRVEAASKLYHNKRVMKVLVSGDNSNPIYNEPEAMMRDARTRNVNKTDLCADYGGRSTYDTCYRAKHIFNINSAIIVTQSYHIPRALYTCQTLGIDAIGLAADQAIGFTGRYPYEFWYNVREIMATIKSIYDLHIYRREAHIMGEKERTCHE